MKLQEKLGKRLRKEFFYLIGGVFIYYDILHELFVTEVTNGKGFRKDRSYEIDGALFVLFVVIFAGLTIALIVVPRLWNAPLPMAVGFYSPAYVVSRMMGGRLR